MSASNFYKKNASNYYIIASELSDDETDFMVNYYAENELQFRIDDLKDSIESLGYTPLTDYYDDERSYPGMYFADKTIYKGIWAITRGGTIRTPT